ncbi:MAG TPA: LuxR C-terminal-related transcriptional regulator [Jatrophihabitantaceae bacterium]|jgi:predicted ATPase/DNA-binding CsgD family transcriptional regulator
MASGSEVPVPLSPFVGRRVELDDLDAVLHEHRLVTLLGIGGIGKTRLALEVATRWCEIVDEVIVVDFAALQTGDLVDGALLEAAGIGSQSGRAALDATIEHLARRPALVVLDTCEHVLASAAHVAQRLLRTCPAVRVLTTSRTLLDVPGEVAWPVPPLRIDPCDAARSNASADAPPDAPPDAVALFGECAVRARPAFRLDAGSTDAVARIVRGVDGIPLAIELAAARLRVLTVDEIASGLSDHLRLLGGGPVTAARHHTMRASLDWSYALLDPQLRRLFARLSVFTGGWTLPAAEAVCADEQLPASAMLDAIAGLVDRSLVSARPDGPITRYRMLDFVQQYARERLAADAGAEDIALRHRRFFRDLAEHADRELWAVQPAGRARLDAEAPNFRQAVTHAIADPDDPEKDALRLVGALALYWRERGRLGEGIQAIEQALVAAPPQPSGPRALALAVLSTLCTWRGDFARTASAAKEAIAMAEAIGDARALSHALGRLGCLVTLAEPAAGEAMLRQAVELGRQAADDVALGDALVCLALGAHFQDDRASMVRLADEAMAVAGPRGYDNDLRWCLWCLAHGALAAGDLAAARAFGERAHGLLTGQDPFGHMCAVEVLSIVDALSGDAAGAQRRAAAALERARQEAGRLASGVVIHALAVAALAVDDLPTARSWATRLSENEAQGVGYLEWRAQEVLMRVALARGDASAARSHGDSLIRLADRLSNRRVLAIAHTGLARAMLLDGDHPRAELLARDALGDLCQHGWPTDATAALEIVAAAAATAGRAEPAARLFGAAAAHRAKLGVVRIPAEIPLWEGYSAIAHDALGPARFAAAVDQGAHLSLDEAVAYARRGRRRPKRAAGGWRGLSPVEEQVARLAVGGRSNVQIAEELFISRSTVKAHLSHIYAKAGVANRVELAHVASGWSG